MTTLLRVTILKIFFSTFYLNSLAISISQIVNILFFYFKKNSDCLQTRSFGTISSIVGGFCTEITCVKNSFYAKNGYVKHAGTEVADIEDNYIQSICFCNAYIRGIYISSYMVITACTRVTCSIRSTNIWKIWGQ